MNAHRIQLSGLLAIYNTRKTLVDVPRARRSLAFAFVKRNGVWVEAWIAAPVRRGLVGTAYSVWQRTDQVVTGREGGQLKLCALAGEQEIFSIRVGRPWILELGAHRWAQQIKQLSPEVWPKRTRELRGRVLTVLM